MLLSQHWERKNHVESAGVTELHCVRKETPFVSYTLATTLFHATLGYVWHSYVKTT